MGQASSDGFSPRKMEFIVLQMMHHDYLVALLLDEISSNNI